MLHALVAVSRTLIYLGVVAFIGAGAMIGGALTGNVDVSGSINQFYCGWLLTGDARGIVEAGFVDRPQNFRAGGDIREVAFGQS